MYCVEPRSLPFSREIQAFRTSSFELDWPKELEAKVASASFDAYAVPVPTRARRRVRERQPTSRLLCGITSNTGFTGGQVLTSGSRN